jgi:hypothetical protein
VDKVWGKTIMRKGTVLLAAIFAVGIATGAEAAKKKAAPAKPDPAVAANQNTAAFVSAAFQPLTPARSADGASKGKKKK